MYGQEMIDRWERTLEKIQEAISKSGRDKEDVRLVAVSKLHPAQAVTELAKAGQKEFGENYAQEALQKQAENDDPGLKWHFIGRLQTNKAKYLAGNFALIHSLDSLKMAQALNKRLTDSNLRQPVLMQVNVADEEQKGGVEAKDLFRIGLEIEKISGLDLQGLMCMPPFFSDGEKSRPYFARLREYKLQLESRLDRGLEHLSMGMSADFAQAIEEGATLLRIGTQIFGQRPDMV
ncbi:MAG TPA: YggS family pyridoxal phosphate-dependent enzyme [Desulfohalobiaceae bacterium]|nr:YggS family pyridoxal phosphate-dependent enzyme [Desulfohalobiaceae bacterium]